MELRAPSRRRGVIRLRLGLCRRTRQIVADALGPRDDATARLLWDRIPLAYRWSPLYTDPLESDHKSLPTPTHADYPKRGPTNHMERFNNTLRQRLGRFVRNAWFFSKSLQMHEIAIRCFLHQYNLTGRRIKPTLAIKAFGFSVLAAYPPPRSAGAKRPHYLIISLSHYRPARISAPSLEGTIRTFSQSAHNPAVPSERRNHRHGPIASLVSP
ncbi:MAG: IS1 family transposase [Gammaproteobacteria bacterium]|nr:IS1 family transposase [Gammaproteobacteria bacterium]